MFATRAITHHQTVTELVNLSGRQRMLSQQIALFALGATLDDSSEARVARTQLKATVDEFAANEARLGQDAAGFPRVARLRSEEHIARGVAEYIASARTVADATRPRAQRQAALASIRGRADALLGELDRVVEAFGATHAVDELLSIERTLTAMAMGLLLLESLFIFRPLVRRVQAYHRRLEQRAFELAAKNEQLNQFAYIASHDLQEPLRTVSSFVGLLEAKLGDTSDEESRTFMGFAVEAANRAQQLVADMLGYCRTTQQELQFEQVDLEQLMAKIRKDLASVLDETGTTLEEGELFSVVGVRTELRQVLQNLVANAIKFAGRRRPRGFRSARSAVHRAGPCGSRTTVSASPRSIVSGSSVRFSGFTFVASILERASACPWSMRSCGVIRGRSRSNLSWVKAVHLSVDLQNSPWQTTRLRRLRVKSTMTEHNSLRVLSTLIVDDDPADVYLVKMQLEQTGRFEQILVAETGEDAIELYRNYEKSRAQHPGKFPPLVILLDINMPRMNGFEFLEAYEELQPNMPEEASAAVFLMLTSSGRETDRKRAEDFAIVRGFMTKPFTAEDALAIADRFGTQDGPAGAN